LEVPRNVQKIVDLFLKWYTLVKLVAVQVIISSALNN